MDNRKLRFVGTTQITNQGHEEEVYELCDENDMTVAYVTDPDADKELVKRWNAYLDLIEAMENLLRYCVTTKGLPDAGKGRTEDQQSALDAARAAIAKTRTDHEHTSTNRAVPKGPYDRRGNADRRQHNRRASDHNCDSLPFGLRKDRTRTPPGGRSHRMF